MQRFKVIVDTIHYEIESVYNNKRNVTQFDIYLDGKKQFAIEPKVIYGQGKEILWTETSEDIDKHIDRSIIENIGSAIESFIN
jgi:hypothetical protein